MIHKMDNLDEGGYMMCVRGGRRDMRESFFCRLQLAEHDTKWASTICGLQVM